MVPVALDSVQQHIFKNSLIDSFIYFMICCLFKMQIYTNFLT